jgi:hypothetical protein
MAFVQKKNYKWFVIISLFVMMLLPSVMPSPRLGDVSVILCGGIALLFEFLSFKTAQNRKETIQNAILFVLTISLVVVSLIF